jgi:hypothetical protein
MRRCRFVVLFFSILIPVLCEAQEAVPPAGTIEGTIVDADTGTAIDGAMVSGRARSGSDGRFVLSGISAGEMFVRATREGYTDTILRFTIEPGQQIKAALFRMRAIGRGGVISGRIVDSSGRPVVLATIALFERGYPGGLLMFGASEVSPRLELVCCALPQRTSFRTNDLGEFRIPGLSPGRYVVAIGESVSRGATFYPGTQDPSKAVQVEVQEGQETRLGSVTLPVPLGKIQVRLADAAGNAVSTTEFGRVIYRYDGVPEGTPILSGTVLLDSNGIADFPVSFAGPYAIDVVARLRGRKDVMPPVPDSQHSGQSLVEYAGGVFTSSVKLHEDPSQNPTHGFSQGLVLKGRVSLEGTESRPAQQIGNILFMTDTPPSRVLTPMLNLIGIEADGSFEIADLHSGDYSILGFTPFVQDYYIVSARQGERNALEDGVRAAAPVEIVLSAQGGQLKGIVIDDTGRPVHDAVVGLVPEGVLSRRRDRKETHRTERTDQNGAVELKRLIPGSYRIYAWSLSGVSRPARFSDAADSKSIIEDGAILDPEFMRKFQALGRPIEIRKGERATIEIPVIR